MLIERRSGRRLMNQINVVPYIDVMLVLLVIFMVTAPLVNPGQVDLPSVGKSSQPAIAPMEVSIRADESIWLARGNPNAWSRADREALVQEHARKLQAEGFRGYVEAEAEARAAREIAAAGSKALRNVKIVPDGFSMNVPLHPGAFRK